MPPEWGQTQLRRCKHYPTEREGTRENIHSKGLTMVTYHRPAEERYLDNPGRRSRDAGELNSDGPGFFERSSDCRCTGERRRGLRPGAIQVLDFGRAQPVPASLLVGERNAVRRVLEAEVKNGVLRVAVQRLGQARPSKLEICRERDRRSPTARRTEARVMSKS